MQCDVIRGVHTFTSEIWIVRIKCKIDKYQYRWYYNSEGDGTRLITYVCQDNVVYS
jgi:hypothetical protein